MPILPYIPNTYVHRASPVFIDSKQFFSELLQLWVAREEGASHELNARNGRDCRLPGCGMVGPLRAHNSCRRNRVDGTGEGLDQLGGVRAERTGSIECSGCGGDGWSEAGFDMHDGGG